MIETFAVLPCQQTASVLVGGYQFVGGGGEFMGTQSYENGQIYYFNNNGTLLWSYDFGVSPVMSIVMSLDGSLIGADTDDKILYFDEHGKFYRIIPMVT